MFELLNYFKNDDIVGIKFVGIKFYFYYSKSLLIRTNRKGTPNDFDISLNYLCKWIGGYKSINKCIDYA